MDGRFVPNLTIGPLVVEAVRRVTTLPIDVHLMIEEPERYLEAFVQAGADNLTVHVETCAHLHRTIEHIKELGARASVTLNPATSLATIEEILPYVDMVLVMSVWPGFGGQTFMPDVLSTVEQLRDRLRPDQRLEIDGGIDASTVGRVVRAGADTLVAGSSIFLAESPADAVRELRRLAVQAGEEVRE